MSEQTSRPENKMGTQPIPSLLFSMAIPIMLSMMVQALYNVVDSIFVAKLSEDALTAVSLGFPMQNLVIAFATGLGVGINALLSRSLGEKNQRMVRYDHRQCLHHGLHEHQFPLWFFCQPNLACHRHRPLQGHGQALWK